MKKNFIIKSLYKLLDLSKTDSSFLFYLKKMYKRPSTLMIHPNYECNFDCPYCYLQTKMGQCLSLNELKDLIIQAKHLGVYSVDILGGEPLVYKDFEELIYYVLNNKMSVNIFTNGALINQPLLDRFKKHKNKIIFIIKLDSMQCYQKQNNPSITFIELTKRIRLLRNVGFRIIAFIVVTKNNYRHIDSILDFCNNENIVPVFERFAPVKNNKINRLFLLTPLMWNEVLIKVKQFWEKKGMANYIDFYAHLNGSVCSCLSNNITVMQDGIVKPCPEAHDNLIYGDIRKKSLKEIWKDSQKLRDEFMKIPQDCKMCINAPSCRGGCRVYTYQIKKSLRYKDPLCNGNIITTYPHCGFSLLRANILKDNKINESIDKIIHKK